MERKGRQGPDRCRRAPSLHAHSTTSTEYLDGIVHRPLSPPAGHGGGCRAHGDELAFRGAAEFQCCLVLWRTPSRGKAIIPTARPPPPPPQGLESGLAAATLTRESYEVAAGGQTSRWHWIWMEQAASPSWTERREAALPKLLVRIVSRWEIECFSRRLTWDRAGDHRITPSCDHLDSEGIGGKLCLSCSKALQHQKGSGWQISQTDQWQRRDGAGATVRVP